MTSTATPVSPAEPLWEVVQEHFDEAEYLVGSFERQLDDPLLTLDDLGNGAEQRLNAHVDALAVGGTPVLEQLLVPALEAAGEADAARVTAATLALLRGPRPRRIEVGLFHADPTVRAAAVRACLLAPSPQLSAWALERWQSTSDPGQQATLMPLVGARLDTSTLLACLQSDDLGLRVASAGAVALGPQQGFAPIIGYMLERDELPVRAPALLAGLAWGVPNAWRCCEQWALDAETSTPFVLALYAALGGPAEQARVAQLLDSPKLKLAALVALGFLGDPGRVPALIEITGGADPLAAKAAAHAIALITGVDLNDRAYDASRAPAQSAAKAAPANDDEIPSFEEDDLEADLVPPSIDALDPPYSAALTTFWQQNRARFASEQRYLWGKPFGLEALFDFLATGPLGPRHTAAALLGVRSGGHAWLDSRAFRAQQRNRLADLRALGLRSFTRSYGQP